MLILMRKTQAKVKILSNVTTMKCGLSIVVKIAYLSKQSKILKFYL